MKHKSKFDETEENTDVSDFENETEEVTITLSRDDTDVLYRILTKIGHGKIKTFDGECKFCGKPIKMLSVNGGDSWKPTNPKTGEKHKCKKGIEHYKNKFNKEHGKY